MLNKYSEMVRGGLSKGDRSKLVAVITIEVSIYRGAGLHSVLRPRYSNGS